MATALEALRTLRSYVQEGVVPRYTVTPGAALNTIIEEMVDPVLRRGEQSSRTFEEVRAINVARCIRWHGPAGVHDWSVVDWSNAMAGEAGEVCNAVKKYRRVENNMVQKEGPQDLDAARDKIAMEIGDTFLYLQLLAEHLGLRIEDCIVNTFNRVSEREGFPERL